MHGQLAGLVRGQQDHLGDYPRCTGRHRGHGDCDCCLHPPEGEEDPEDEVSDNAMRCRLGGPVSCH